ncbi:unnamed protein product [Ilex paraguariensis]|uniref:Uncharacterized protein n=1 Tax=Ilex paraguariensis TaxID=185542 RepID=A0ABC8QW21_9AQUA
MVIDSLLKLKILSLNGASTEKVTLGPPSGTLRTVDEINTDSCQKSGTLEIFLAPVPQTSTKY